MTDGMTDASTRAPVTDTPVIISEDRRRPKAVVPYAALWIVAILCVVFALISMFLRG